VIFITRNEAYELLGLKAGAAPEEIKSAYRNLVKKYHADKVLHIEDENLKKTAKELFEEKMRKINAAYELLSSKTSDSSETSSGDSGSATGEPYDEGLEKIHSMYFRRQEAELFRKTFENFKQKKGYEVYDRQKKDEDIPRGQIFDFLDEESPAMPFDTMREEEKPADSSSVKKKEEKSEKPLSKGEKVNRKLIFTYLVTVYLFGWIMAGAIYLFGGREDSETFMILKGISVFLPVISLIFISWIFPFKMKLPYLKTGKISHYLLCWIFIFAFITVSFAFTVLFNAGTFDRSLSVLKPVFVINDRVLEELEPEFSSEKLKALEYFKDKDFSRKEMVENLKGLDFPEREIEIILTYSVRGNLNKDFNSPERQFIAFFVLATSFCLVFSTLLAFGGEYAWRGFLLTELTCLGKKKAALLTGFFCGLWYIPFVLIGDYSQGHSFFWFPWSGEPLWYKETGLYYQSHILIGISIKILFSIFFGFILARIYFVSKNILSVCFAFAVFEQLTPLGYILVRDVNPLAGGPEGVAGLCILLIISLILFFLPWEQE